MKEPNTPDRNAYKIFNHCIKEDKLSLKQIAKTLTKEELLDLLLTTDGIGAEAKRKMFEELKLR